jgi:sulfatase modifying factor 1
MNSNAKCPVCKTNFGASIPDFCPICGWECGTDISLIPSLNKPSQSDLEYHHRKLDLAKELWNKTQAQLQDQAKKQADNERELAALRKQLAEKDKDKAVAERQAAEARYQIKALEKDNASLKKELEEAQELIKDLKDGKNQAQPTIITPLQSSETSPDMILVEGGSFLRGDHKVELSSFYIGRFPVTQKQWRELVGSSPFFAYGRGDNFPVYEVSWYDAIKFCNLLSLAEGLTPVYSILDLKKPAAWGIVPTGANKAWNAAVCDWAANGYRLPTEAEWEFAARGGNISRGYKYSGGDKIDLVAWYKENSDDKTHSVGEKKANELGVYDMSGNVWEWCWDRFGAYSSDFQTNPTGPRTGKDRCLRGGSWINYTNACYVSYKLRHDSPYRSTNNYGFRLCRSKK